LSEGADAPQCSVSSVHMGLLLLLLLLLLPNVITMQV
jgi:hypothetical protein